MAPKKGKRPHAKNARMRAATAPRNIRNFATAESLVTGIIANNHAFTMRDEARNTTSHQLPLGTSLRTKPVQFVSAGYIEPLKKPELLPTASPTLAGIDAAGEIQLQLEEIQEATAEAAGETSKPLDIDIKQSMSSPSASADDEADRVTKTEGNVDATDQLFFFDLARDETMVGTGHPPVPIPDRQPLSDHSDSSEEIILFKGRNAHVQPTAQPVCEQRNHATSIAHTPKVGSTKAVETLTSTKVVIASRPASAQGDKPTPTSKEKNSKRESKRAQKYMEDDDEDEILADYIANLADDSDGDDILTSHLRIFANRRDIGGNENTVNFGDDSDDMDAMFETGGSNASDDSDENEQLDIDEEDIDDETLARLFAKQEELGMGSNELVLFSEEAAFNVRKVKNKKRTGRTESFPSATAVADAFDGLELTDGWVNPGFIPPGRNRRSKQPPNFNVSDSEVELVLKTAWQKDRERKKQRKLEREELRAQGLLGKHANPDDLCVKYLTGMTLDDIKTELVAFLLTTEESLQFPPMDKQARKVLHELANKFKIKSQSTGKGDQRRPILYRTKATLRYKEHRIEEVVAHVDQAAVRINRKYFHRLDAKGKPSYKCPSGGGGGRSGHKAVTVREGEIVGASAPELSQENKGRAMLEKMGWSKGMGLGSLDNKGILEPVKQIVKRSKAGLG
ncbi:hypothetical protein QBC32DRAFT_347161 [Pseudoneurospora amorphoporcata]|uniref:Protein SQS1 n=1 Tax=Pseudoneurospora amorphoporcata TaxID=241081 RepID=A0AAN6NUQ4_9PEZI|nr:hypothetical protein QBC32DRAFT_347161 [Pseudoneurospora amorphoporcata]